MTARTKISAEKQTPQNTVVDLQLCFGGFSFKGLKAENQDAFAAIIPKQGELRAKGAVAAIADGVSSASKAAEASQLAVTQFIQEYLATPETWSTQKSAAKVLTSLNNWLYSQSGFVDNFVNVLLYNVVYHIFHSALFSSHILFKSFLSFKVSIHFQKP